jgi:hypothetical protein
MLYYYGLMAKSARILIDEAMSALGKETKK